MSGLNEPKPGLGAVVHYVSGSRSTRTKAQQCHAAIVTEVTDSAVGLAVLSPAGLSFQQHVCQDRLPPVNKIVPGERCEWLPDTWHWPDRT